MSGHPRQKNTAAGNPANNGALSAVGGFWHNPDSQPDSRHKPPAALVTLNSRHKPVDDLLAVKNGFTSDKDNYLLVKQLFT